jgi:ribosomal protein L35
MKTNKSYKKRLKVTKSGKVLSRKVGHNHFNSKESRRSQLIKKGNNNFNMTMKDKSRFLSNIK